MRASRTLEKLTRRISSAQALDGPADAAAAVLGRVVRPGPVEDLLSGVPSGHPLHPVLITVPIGAWVSAGVMDATGQPDAARRLIGLGLLAALPASATGASDWLSTQGPERRVGLAHAALNYAALGAYAVSWAQRRAGRRTQGVVWSVVGGAALLASGHLGGHLAYALGVGVDTTAFQHLPTEWTDVLAEGALPHEGQLTAADLDGLPLLVTRRHGEVVVLGDWCTHRGGPLHEGEVRHGCVVCPWHDSAFSLDDGGVESGPATRPQPVFETRLRDGRLQVRHPSPTSLQQNPVGA